MKKFLLSFILTLLVVASVFSQTTKKESKEYNYINYSMGFTGKSGFIYCFHLITDSSTTITDGNFHDSKTLIAPLEIILRTGYFRMGTTLT